MAKKPNPTQEIPTIPCPACGFNIPLAEAVAHAVAERTLKLEQASNQERVQRDRKLQQQKLDAERRLAVLTSELTEAHAREISSLRGKLEREQKRLLARLQEEAEQREALTRQSMEDARGREDALMNLRQAVADRNASLARTAVERQAAFEQGRTTGMKQLELILDDVRREMAEREAAHAKGLADAIQKAQRQAVSDEQRRQKANLQQILEREKVRITQQTEKAQAVARQRHESELAKLRQEIEALHRKAEANPSDPTGHAAEDVLERRIKETFERDGDFVTRTQRGKRGADLLLSVRMAGKRSILMESKWTQTFDSAWIAKIQKDRAAAGAEVAILVTRALPPGVEHLGLVKDVWVASHETVLPLLTALRQGLLAMERATRASGMDEAKVQELKKYLSGPQFRQQIEQIVRLAAEQSESVLKERTQHERAWTQAKDAHDRILASAIAVWTALELHSGNSLQASEVLKPFLTLQEQAAMKPRKGRQAA